ncbi:MAG: hypothetical protein KDD60_12700 [Bdellovibrionales bacterium]|nr:hypothetical protein [Bdellovibrionales bacterium]
MWSSTRPTPTTQTPSAEELVQQIQARLPDSLRDCYNEIVNADTRLKVVESQNAVQKAKDEEMWRQCFPISGFLEKISGTPGYTDSNPENVQAILDRTARALSQEISQLRDQSVYIGAQHDLEKAKGTFLTHCQNLLQDDTTLNPVISTFYDLHVQDIRIALASEHHELTTLAYIAMDTFKGLTIDPGSIRDRLFPVRSSLVV